MINCEEMQSLKEISLHLNENEYEESVQQKAIMKTNENSQHYS